LAARDVEGLIKLLFFLVGLCLLIISFLFLPFTIQAHKARKLRQRDAMAQKARDLGLQFDGESSRETAKEYSHLDKLRRLSGSDEHALNIMRGDFQGHPITLFDFHYATSGPWWWSPSWKIHHYVNFTILKLNRSFPELTIGAEGGGLLGKIFDALGGGDIDFESHEFSKRYDVRSDNKKFAYDFCNAQMIDYLLDRRPRYIEVDTDSLAVGSDSQHDVRNMESELSHLLKIRSLMPNYLFDVSPG
jgi:hypothetical protein